MADSLNSAIQRLGDTISSNLFGNKSNNPVGSTNFSGVYFGPGGKVITRSDSILIGNTKSDQKRYGSSFKPVGYYTGGAKAEWIDDSLKSLWETVNSQMAGPPDLSTNPVPFAPGILRKNLIKVKDSTGEEIDYKEIYGSNFDVSLDGFTPPGYHTINDIWIDARLSPKIKEINNLIRTYVMGRLNSETTPMRSPLKRIDADIELGFTPITYYYNKESGKYSVFLKNQVIDDTEEGIVSNEEAQSYMKLDGVGGFYKNKSDSDYRFKFGIEEDKITNAYNISNDDLSEGQINISKVGLKASETPKDNEDPLYTGFEIIINNLTSPIFNGTAMDFINKFAATSEIASRNDILSDFIFECSKFFKFSSESDLTFLSSTSKVFNTPLNRKRHYIKRINGINKLIESNTPSQQSSFVKYRNDLITLSFYEDTTLELGTLMSLYKSLYWSRINGKNIIPENLLRFDCRIIVSEVRNFTRIRKASGDNEMLQTLKENVSRYVYDLYECQLFFDKMSHGDAVTMESMNSPDSSEISMSWKYSTMAFERYNYDANRYKHIDNKQINPMEDTPSNSNNAEITADGFNFNPSMPLEELYNGYSGKDILSSDVKKYRKDPDDTATVNYAEGTINPNPNTPGIISSGIEDLKDQDKKQIYQKGLPSNKIDQAAIDAESTVVESKGLYGKSALNYPKIEDKTAPKDNNSNFKKAGELLLNNVKKAALNEAQRQLNNQFRLVNNSLDKIRNSFGIGRMRDPTNVYSNLPNSQFFFDVKNSLRDFGGDVLGGLLGG